MSSVNLLLPAESGFDLTVLHARSVSNDKMVSDTEPVIPCGVFSFLMFVVYGFDAARCSRRMVDDNPFPVTSID